MAVYCAEELSISGLAKRASVVPLATIKPFARISTDCDLASCQGEVAVFDRERLE